MKYKAILVSIFIVMVSIYIVMISVAMVFASTDEAMTVLPQKLTMAKGTIINVQATGTITSQKNKKNDRAHFKVTEDIMLGGVIIVPANTDVEAVITKIKKAGAWDNDGELEITFSEIKTKDGTSIPVLGEIKVRGENPQFLVKYSLLGVFVKGKEAVVKTGTELKLQVKEAVEFSNSENFLTSHPEVL